LFHEPLIRRFRKNTVLRQKIIRRKAREEYDHVENLKKIKNRPESINHIIRERYPTFHDAMRDLDDVLSLLHLFGYVPIRDKRIRTDQINEIKQLCREFQNYVVLSRSLRKVFLSIKGIFYQAEIEGHAVTWLIPYNFPHSTPDDVDLSVMLSFLLLYETMLGFVNYQLYTNINYAYPPTLIEDTSGSGLTSLLNEPRRKKHQRVFKTNQGEVQQATEERLATLENKLKELPDLAPEDIAADDPPVKDDDEIPEEFQEEETKETEKPKKAFANLFDNCVFFLSREVPWESLEFVIKSFGGTVQIEDDPRCLPETEQNITHQIVDRDSTRRRFLSRDYLQPQWVYDSVNARVLLPVETYSPTSKLPPHLSPFVNDAEMGYIPERRLELDLIIRNRLGTDALPTEEKAEDDGDFSASENEEEQALLDVEDRYMKELAAEREGKTFVNQIEEQQTEESEKALEKEEKRQMRNLKRKQTAERLSTVVLSGRKRFLYKKLKRRELTRESTVDKLKRRRKLQQKSKAESHAEPQAEDNE